MVREVLSDSDLIAKLRKGNDEEKKEAILALYDRYKNLVLKLCYQRLRDYDAASEVLHDVFLRVIQKADGLKEGALFKVWIISITRNCCVDLLRKTSYLKNSEPLTPKIRVSRSERTEDFFIASLHKEKILRLLSGCLETLESFHLNILKLRWKGYRTKELCRIFSIDRTEMRRCYDTIKKSLEICMQSKGVKISIEQIVKVGELDE